MKPLPPRRRAVRALEPRWGTRLLAYLLLTLASAIAVIPFFYVLSTSVKETRSLFSYPPEWIPRTLFWGNFERLFVEFPFVQWTLNTLLTGLAVTLLKLVIDSLAAYALAKLEFPGRRFLSGVLLASVAIPVAALVIPLFFLVRSMGLLDTYWALILPPLANPLGIFMIRSFLVSLPDDLGHSARLDGAREIEIFTRIMLPLIKPGLVVHAIFTFMNYYTSFLWPLVAVQSPDKRVLTVGISSLKANFVVDWGLISAASVLAAIPITLLFIVLQRYFLAQDISSALKG